MPSNLTTQALSPALAGILAAEVKAKNNDRLITSRDAQGRCFHISMPQANSNETDRDIIRRHYAGCFGYEKHQILLSSADSNGEHVVYGPCGELGKSTVSLADHDADKRRRAE